MNVTFRPTELQGRAPLVIPSAFWELYLPARYKAYFGGRGSAKSHSFGRALLNLAGRTLGGLRVMCCREIQKSIRDSVKRLLDDLIEEQALVTWAGMPFWSSTDTEIRGDNDSVFSFAGLRTNVDQVKSTEGLDIAWVEEANKVSSRSLEILRPTLRSEESEMWFSWNPEFPTDPVDAMFRVDGRVRTPAEGLPPRSIVRQVNWQENPFFPRVLAEEMEYDARRDPEKHLHVWGGGYRRHSGAAVFRRGRDWDVEAFETPPDVARFYLGADWGFATDPSVLVRSWIHGRRLYVDYEAWAVGCEIDHLPALFAGSDPLANREMGVLPRWINPRPDAWRGVPGALKWPIRADSARPDTISYVRRRGFQIQSATKGPNSVEEGIEFLKSYFIVVHPRCPHVIDELNLYSYKVDPQNEEIVLPVLEDRKNHTIDALRYSHEGSRRGGAGTTAVPVH